MRIESIRIANFIGLRAFEREFRQPIVLVAGRNGAGKSSLQAAVRMAILGEPERVVLKKDYDKLVTEGAAGGEAAIRVRVGEGLDAESTVVHVALPDGKPTPFTKRPLHVEYCLDVGRFARLAEDERRTFLFALTGLKLDSGTVRKRLLDRGCDEKLVDIVAPELRHGFAGAHKVAADMAREAKGAWRGVTGETWGKDKAATWKPQEVAFSEIEREILERVQRDLATGIEAERDAGNHLAGLEARAANTPALGGDLKKATKIPDIERDLAESTAERDKWSLEASRLREIIEAPHGMACPHCGGLVTQDGFSLVAYDGQTGDQRAEARAALTRAEESLRLMRTKVANLERDRTEALSHKAKLEAAEKVKEAGPTPHELTVAKENLALAQDKCRSLRAEEKRMTELQRTAAAASQASGKAQALHHEVCAWLVIVDALAPSGLPGEMLSTALAPFNQKLREASVMTGWRQVAIGADMAIASEGRPYALLSESERWRSDAMIGYAIASHGPRFLMLDRLDILDVNARGEALAWLAALVEQHRLDGALICATLKGAPATLPAGCEGFWLEGGRILDLQEAA